MVARLILGFVVVAGCKTEPASLESQPRVAERPPAPAAARRPGAARIPAPAPAAPTLPPAMSDLNPPGVPHLAGEVRDGERGLQYIDEVIGTGPAPVKGKPVKVHYTGWLTDGTKFDSSRDRDVPIEVPFDAGAVIRGWDLGLASMRVGGKRRLLLPADIAYGSSGIGDVIPPDAVLVFDVELLEVGTN